MRMLSERHTGLLIRMSFHRTAVGPKSVFAPLIRRGLAEAIRQYSYALTSSGKRAAKTAIEQNIGKQLKTFGGISIGNAVMIVKSK